MIFEVLLITVFVIGCVAALTGLTVAIVHRARGRADDGTGAEDLTGAEDGSQDKPRLHGGPGGFIGSQY